MTSVGPKPIDFSGIGGPANDRSNLTGKIQEKERQLGAAEETGTSQPENETKVIKGKEFKVGSSGAQSKSGPSQEELRAQLDELKNMLSETIRGESKGNEKKVAGKAEAGKSPESQSVASNDKPQEVKSDNSVAKSDSTASASPTSGSQEAPKKQLEKAT
jgi:hypothetical protein